MLVELLFPIGGELEQRKAALTVLKAIDNLESEPLANEFHNARRRA